MIKIISVQFAYDDDPTYKILMDVLKHSAKINMPHAKFIDIRVPSPKMEMVPGYKMLASNTYKLGKWIEAIDESKRGDRFAFLDCDMLIMKDFSKVFDYDFDIAYTYRPDHRLPLNGGALFVKPTKKAKEFLKQFKEINYKMLTDKKFHDPYRRMYAGMNQAALGWMLEESNHAASVLAIPCPIWNVCNEDWHKIHPEAYILHLKGRLRHMCLGSLPVAKDIKSLVDLWAGYKNKMVADRVEL